MNSFFISRHLLADTRNLTPDTYFEASSEVPEAISYEVSFMTTKLRYSILK